MKNMKRILVTLVAAVLLMAVTVAGTLAWLTSTSAPVNNTFVVGDVKIELDETTVTYNKAENYWKSSGDRTNENTYKILPGVQIDKDPTVYVLANSEDCYVRTIVSVTYSKEADTWFAEKKIDPLTWVTWNNSWIKPAAPYKVEETETTVTRLYEVRYNAIVALNEQDTPLAPVFTKITIPEDLSNTDIALLANFKVDVIAHAIQSDGFANADEAWYEFALPASVPVGTV